MSKKLKTVLLLPSRAYGVIPAEYVPAAVAQGLLDALNGCREHMEWSTAEGKKAYMIAGYAIAAATEEE